MIIAQAGIHPKREQAFDFSVPYIYSAPQRIVRKDDALQYRALAALNRAHAR